MEEIIRRLGDAELEIMQAVWAAEGPVSSVYVQQALRGRRDWALGALMTALSRLCDKGFLRREKQGRNNLYAPLIDEQTYQQREGRTFGSGSMEILSRPDSSIVRRTRNQ